MFIATLNYSVSYTYASLHKLTLLRLLDQNIDENGNRYRLVVTPEADGSSFRPTRKKVRKADCRTQNQQLSENVSNHQKAIR